MFCHNCGAKLNPGSKFCGSCGQKTEPGAENRASGTPHAPTPPPPRAPMAPPPQAAGMMQGKEAYSQAHQAAPGKQPMPGHPPPGQMYNHGPGPGTGPGLGQGFPGQQFNPQFNQKQKSSKGCLIGILVVVLLIIILSAIGLAYVYFAADLTKGSLPSTDLLGSIGLKSSPEKTVEELFEAIGKEDVEGFIALITAESIEFIKADMLDPSITLEQEVADGLYWINTYGVEDYGKDWHKSITYQLTEESGDRARVLASLAGETIDVILLKEDGKWKVDWTSIYGW
ncbi:zinc ribbon domain-containing protein [Desulfitibacter alkalitolerans]|uniref:zinc ribbon domain-containing protein n=1 Tax=Desulfitibacter alkalitolerans TaxID=264641 RepID=UPI000488BC74|nr:zinc ribbon domain-containing protein [Desulfitibacter alkalitolerans]